MTELTTAQLAQACSIFMELAYPAGIASVPLKKRAYYTMDVAKPLADYIPPAAQAGGIAQDLSKRSDGPHSYAFRLGSAHFQHLKLCVQRMEHRGNEVWVFTVDTHDAFSPTRSQPPTDHPESASWLALQDTNRRLKDAIEVQLDQAGFLTFKSLLRGDLNSPNAR